MKPRLPAAANARRRAHRRLAGGISLFPRLPREILSFIHIGKLEICGRIGDMLVLKQIQARSGREEEGSRLMLRQLAETGGWLEDLPEASLQKVA